MPTTEDTICIDFDCHTVILKQEQLFEEETGERLCNKHAKRLAVYGLKVYKPSPGGYRTSIGGSFYVIFHSDLHAIGFGITNTTTARLVNHEKEGWTAIRRWYWHDGTIAKALERHVITRLKERGIEPGLTKGDMPQGGYTETVATDSVDLTEMCKLVHEAITSVVGSAHQLPLDLAAAENPRVC